MPTSPSCGATEGESSEGVCSPGSSVALDLGEGIEDPVLKLKHELKELDKQRSKIERSVLDSLATLKELGVGMHAPLVDEEGFPRADVDVYTVRDARHTVVVGQNDIKALTNLLQTKLEDLHAMTEEDVRRSEAFLKVSEHKSSVASAAAQRDQQKVAVVAAELPSIAEVPGFLQVDAAAPNGPGYQCGLRDGDIIHKIGDKEDAITKANYTGMQQLAEFVGAREGSMIPLLVSSPDVSTSLMVEQFLVPQRWEGRGLLGVTFGEM
jgi:26S proteasome non-ATPase regulatory subunit 9